MPAIEGMEASMRTVEEEVRGWYAQARKLLDAGQFPEAMAVLERLLQHTNPILEGERPFHGWPEDAPAGGAPPDYFTAGLYLSGRCLAAQGESERALSFLAEAARLWPGHVPLHRELAAAYCSRGDYQNALVALQEALAVAPEEAQVRAELESVTRLLDQSQRV